MPTQNSKHCPHCPHVSGNGGAHSSHMKSHHPAEWAAFKAAEAEVKATPRVTKAEAQAVPIGGSTFVVRIHHQIADPDGTGGDWQLIADAVLAASYVRWDEVSAAIGAEATSLVRQTGSMRTMLMPFRLGQQNGSD